MRDLDVVFGAGCAVFVVGIVDALLAADVRLAGVETLFLLGVLVWWMIARQRERKYLEGPPAD